MKDVIKHEFHEPKGWQKISFQQLHGMEMQDPESVFKAKRLQIAILSNHQNGRDSHVRQIRILGPKREPAELSSSRPQDGSIEKAPLEEKRERRCKIV